MAESSKKIAFLQIWKQLNNRSQEGKCTPSIAISTIIVALALLRVFVIVTIDIIPQQAEARPSGCPLTTAAINASKVQNTSIHRKGRE